MRGVITASFPEWAGFALQDQTGAIYISAGDVIGFKAETGQAVEVDGIASPGNFAPAVRAEQIRILANVPFPAAKSVGWRELSSGSCDNDYVEVEGTVRSVERVDRPIWEWNALAIKLYLGGGEVWAYLRDPGTLAEERLLDSTVRVRGVCVVLSNDRRQFQRNSLVISRPGDMEVVKPGLENPFDAELVPMNSLLAFHSGPMLPKRIRVQGVVTLRTHGGIYIQQGSEGMFVQTASVPDIPPGDLVEVVGFPAVGPFSAVLDSALVRFLRRGVEPAARSVRAEDVLSRTHGNVPASPDATLLRISGTLLEISRSAEEVTLIVQDGASVFSARLPRRSSLKHPKSLSRGSYVAVTGVCSVHVDEHGLPRSFDLLLRSLSDIQVLKPAPQITREIALRIASGLLALVALSVLWAVTLRRRVRVQTEAIRQARDELERRVQERTAELFKTGESLRISESRFRLAIENVPDVFVIYDEDRRIQFMNERGLEVVGRSREDVVGRRDEELFPEEIFDCYLPALKRCIETRSVQHTECRFHVRSEQLYLVITYVPVLGEVGQLVQILGITHDITDRKRAEQVLEEKEAFYRTLGDAVPDFIWSRDAHGTPIYTNRRWQEFTGLSLEDVQKRGWHSIIHPDDIPEVERQFQEAVAMDGRFEVQVRYRRHDGTYCWFMGRAVPLKDRAGKIIQWIGTSTDIQRLKEAEVKLRRYNEQLEQFAYAAAHDLQEPLRNVSLYSELLSRSMKGHLEGEQKDFLAMVHTSARRMNNLLRDLLLYTQALDGTAHRHRLDTSALVKQAIDNLAQAIADSGATIDVQTLPAVWAFDAHIVQLFQNLIGNAVKYRSPDRAPVIVVSCERHAEHWLFSVRDNGIGIEPKYHDHIFGVFRRLHGRHVAGTGIGLALCKRIVEHYGGTIWLESSPGDGSTFHFTLPIQQEVPNETASCT